MNFKTVKFKSKTIILSLLILAMVFHLWLNTIRVDFNGISHTFDNLKAKIKQFHIYDKQEKSGPDTSLYFSTQKTSVNLGANLAIDIMIDPGINHVTGCELHISFDPQILKLDKIVPSNVFSLELQPASIDNQAGLATEVLGIPLGQASLSAKASFATLYFSPVNEGTGKISFDSNSIVVADNERANVINKIKNINITVKK